MNLSTRRNLIYFSIVSDLLVGFVIFLWIFNVVDWEWYYILSPLLIDLFIYFYFLYEDSRKISPNQQP